MRSRYWWLVLAAVALLTGVLLLVAPTGESSSCTAGGSGPEACTQAGTTLWQVEGPSVLLPLAVPALACLLAMSLRSRGSRLALPLVAVALLGYCLLTGFTIGLFFLPVAVAALVLGLRQASERPAAAHST